MLATSLTLFQVVAVENHPTFIDETRTGVTQPFRGRLRRATIAARCDADEDDFEWLAKLYRDLAVGNESLMKGLQEPKSELVLQLASKNSACQRALDDNIARAVIVIVDFSMLVEQVLRGLCKAFNVSTQLAGDPEEILATGQVPHAVVETMLQAAKARRIEVSAVSRVESMSTGVEPGPAALALAGAADAAGLASNEPHQLLDRGALIEMGEGEFQEAVARFSISLGEAFHPKQLMRVVESRFERERFFNPGLISAESLYLSTTDHRIFDDGRAGAFLAVHEAHSCLWNRLAAQGHLFMLENLRPGVMVQEDSRNYLGLQAADIAAAIAREIYEGFPNDRRAGAFAVSERFRRVLLNDSWIR